MVIEVGPVSVVVFRSGSPRDPEGGVQNASDVSVHSCVADVVESSGD